MLQEGSRPGGDALWLAGAAGLLVAVLVGLWLYGRTRKRRRARQFEAFFEAAPGALLLVDGERLVTEANEAACTLMGRTVATLRGRRLDEFMDAAGAQPPSAAFETVEAVRGGAAGLEEGASTTRAQTEVRIERPDGSTRQVRLHVRGFAIDGRACTAVTLQDMTTVSEEHSFFKLFHRRTVQNLPIEMAVLSPEGTYLQANPLACTDDISPTWLQGKSDFDLCRRLGLHPEVALRRRSHRRRAIQKGERVTFEEVLSRRDAPTRHVQRYYAPVFDDGAEVHAVVTYAVDQTRLRSRERALEKAERASNDYEEMKATLLRNLRHEFRTPLTSILGIAEILLEDVSKDDREFVEILANNGRRLMRLLNAMLDLAGSQTGSLDRQPRILNLGEATENVVGELQEMAQEKGLFLRKQTLDADVCVRVDPASLYRVLRSIIGNAVKFTVEGGVVVEVASEERHAEVRVLDTGVGIEESHLPRLFEAFNQEDGSMTRAFEGSGVGLAVARRLLDLMGGTVTVDSKKGEGSIFTIALPIAFRNARGERPRLLVAEEQAEQEKLLRHRLGRQTRLTFVETLDDALSMARRRQFEAVLVSAGISPDDSAGDLVEQFRSVAGYENVPLLVIDEDALPGAAEQFRADGYDGYIARPLQREALLNTLGDVLADRTPPVLPAPLDENARPNVRPRAS